MRNVTPINISHLKPNEVLVLGTNQHDIINCRTSNDSSFNLVHKLESHEPIQSKIYKIPISFPNISFLKPYIDSFFIFAGKNPNLIFFVKKFESCEIDISPTKLAPMFIEANKYSNVYLPNEYWVVIDKCIRKLKYSNNQPDIQIDSSSQKVAFSTSISSLYNIKILIHSKSFLIYCGQGCKYSGVCLCIKEMNDKVYDTIYINGVSPYFYEFSQIPNGSYYLELFFKQKFEKYYRLLKFRIQIGTDYITIKDSPNFKHNDNFYKLLCTDSEFLKSKLRLTSVVPGALPMFKKIAENATKYCSSIYDKILAIHDLIAKTIAYDYDSLENGTYKNIPLEKTAITTLKTYKGVCQGYTDLSIALLRSIGIPSMGLVCETNYDDSQESRANHIFTVAFDTNRWLLMDVTWDSDLQYSNSSVSMKTGNGISSSILIVHYNLYL